MRADNTRGLVSCQLSDHVPVYKQTLVELRSQIDSGDRKIWQGIKTQGSVDRSSPGRVHRPFGMGGGPGMGKSKQTDAPKKVDQTEKGGPSAGSRETREPLPRSRECPERGKPPLGPIVTTKVWSMCLSRCSNEQFVVQNSAKFPRFGDDPTTTRSMGGSSRPRPRVGRFRG